MGLVGLGASALLAACGGQASPTAPPVAPTKSATTPASAAPAATSGAAGAPTSAATTKPAAATSAGAASPAAQGAATPAAQAAAPGKTGATITAALSSDSQAVYEAAAKDYKEKSGGTVNLVTQAYDQTHDKIVSGLAGGADYDIVAVDVIWTGEFAQAGFIAPLDDRVNAAMKEKIVPAALAGRSYKDKLYQWPLLSLKYLYYNDDLLKKAGLSEPPKTWEDLLDASKAAQGKGIQFATAWGASQAEGLTCDYVLLLGAFGGKFTDDKGQSVINQGGGLKALQYMVDTLYKDKIADPASLTLTDRTVRNPFAKGQYPFILNWNSAWAQFKDPANSSIVDAVRIGLVPGSKDGGAVSSTCTGGSGFGLAAKSNKKDAAWDYLQYVALTDDAQRRFLKMSNQLPTFKALYDDPQIKKDYPHFEALRKQMDYGFARPALPWYGEWTRIFQIEATNALAQKKTPKQALDDAVKQMNEAAKQYQ